MFQPTMTADEIEEFIDALRMCLGLDPMPNKRKKPKRLCVFERAMLSAQALDTSITSRTRSWKVGSAMQEPGELP